MNTFFKGVAVGLLPGLALFFAGDSFFATRLPDVPVPAQNPDFVTKEELLSVKGENTLLKRMLGEVEGDVLILGPVGKKSAVHGKLVWDMSMQQGFLHVEDLEPEVTYQLILKTKQGAAVVAAENVGQQIWQIQFKSPQRILDLALVEIRGTLSQTGTETVYARGVVSGK